MDPKISRIVLKSLIGKLVHAAHVNPLSCHFLSRFQDRLAWMKEKTIDYPIRISMEEREDVRL